MELFLFVVHVFMVLVLVVVDRLAFTENDKTYWHGRSPFLSQSRILPFTSSFPKCGEVGFSPRQGCRLKSPVDVQQVSAGALRSGRRYFGAWIEYLKCFQYSGECQLPDVIRAAKCSPAQ